MKPISRPQEAALRRFTFPEPDQLSPPILRLDNVATGYDGVPVLQRLTLRIDQDDRIALWGATVKGNLRFPSSYPANLRFSTARNTPPRNCAWATSPSTR